MKAVAIRNAAVALGLFDGVHLGHRAVLAAAAEQKNNGLKPCAFTFPPESTAKKGAAGYIYGNTEKNYIIENECAIERIYSPPFAELCGMDGETFAREILCGEMGAAFVCCGSDFRFGTRASCGLAELAGFGSRYGFTVKAVDDVYCSGKRVSSTEIRSLIESGDIAGANRFLGAPYIIMNEVSHGAALGRTIGFPTANQVFGTGQLVPKYGVYASQVTIDGICYSSMTNIGIKPTVEYGGAPLAETYIHGFSGDIYGRNIRTQLLRFIRPERRFSSVDELRKQIAADVSAAVGSEN